jgi:hypothetical protein
MLTRWLLDEANTVPKLKSCPMCNAPGESVVEKYGDYVGWFYCQCSTVLSNHICQTGYFLEPTEAAEVWNRRNK